MAARWSGVLPRESLIARSCRLFLEEKLPRRSSRTGVEPQSQVLISRNLSVGQLTGSAVEGGGLVGRLPGDRLASHPLQQPAGHVLVPAEGGHVEQGLTWLPYPLSYSYHLGYSLFRFGSGPFRPDSGRSWGSRPGPRTSAGCNRTRPSRSPCDCRTSTEASRLPNYLKKLRLGPIWEVSPWAAATWTGSIWAAFGRVARDFPKPGAKS